MTKHTFKAAALASTLLMTTVAAHADCTAAAARLFGSISCPDWPRVKDAYLMADAIPILDVDGACLRLWKTQDLSKGVVKGCIRGSQRHYDLITYYWNSVPVLKRKACLVWAQSTLEDPKNNAPGFYAALDICLDAVLAILEAERPRHFQSAPPVVHGVEGDEGD
jgi:hypothetical protein